MFLGEGTQIKLFHFYKSDSSIGVKSREDVEKNVNDFLKEYEGNIIKIELSDNIIMVIYRAY